MRRTIRASKNKSRLLLNNNWSLLMATTGSKKKSFHRILSPSSISLHPDRTKMDRISNSEVIPTKIWPPSQYPSSANPSLLSRPETKTYNSKSRLKTINPPL
jgi:hypothetical protein